MQVFVVYFKNDRIHTETFRPPNHTTVFQAEIETIYRGTQFMLSYVTDKRVRYIKIISDSQAAIAALRNIDIK